MKIFRGKQNYILLISLLVSLFSLWFSISNPEFIKPVRNIVFDGYQQIKPRVNAESSVVIADIDEASIAKLGQWPWPRSTLATIVDRLTAAGALAIGFDIVFSEPDRTSPSVMAEGLPKDLANQQEIAKLLRSLPDNDAVFANAISKAPVVLSFFGAHGKNAEKPRKIAGVSWLGDDLSGNLNAYDGGISSLKKFQDRASGQGFISLTERDDDIIRNVQMFSSQNGVVYPLLSIELLRVAIQNAVGSLQSFLIKTTFSGTEGGNVDAASGNRASITSAKVANFEFPLTEHGEMTVYYAKDNPDQYFSIADVLEKTPDELTSRFEGKIVIVGTSAAGLRDIRTTTLREAVPGVSIHAQIIDQIMQGEFLNRPDWAIGAEAALAIILSVAIVLVLPFIGALASALFGAICALAIVATSWLAFDWHGLLIDPSLPLLTSLLAYLLTTALLYFFAEKEKRFVRTAFQHYLAPDLLSKLEENPESLKLGGEIREMTLMFLDVRNFTPISEKLDPQELVAFLNDLLSPLSDIIQKHEGAIDKYIGDSIMAFWNAPLDVEHHPEKACRAALEMLEKVKEMNADNAFGFRERGLGDVGIGIGINTGEGCVGNMGSATRFDYSVVGDTVNVAARLESASKDAKWPILVSHATALAVPEFAFLDAGKLALKGKSESQVVHALIGDEAMKESQQFSDIEAAKAKLSNAKGRNNKEAKEGCLKLVPPQLHGFILNQLEN